MSVGWGYEAVEGRPRWIRRLVTITIALVAVIVFGSIVLRSYDQGTEEAASVNVPVIRADTTPYRVPPKDPGGMEVPDRDKKVFEVIDPGQARPEAERLLGEAESPVQPPSESAPPLAAQPATPPLPPAAAPAASGASGAAPAEQPKAAAPQPAGDKSIAALPPEAPPMEKPAAKPAPAPTPEPAAQPKPAAKKAAPTVTVAALERSFRIQILSIPSETAVRQQWERLRKSNSDLFGGLKLLVKRADLGRTKGVYYRLQIGPLANEAKAKALCARVKARRMGCLIVRP